MATQSSRYHKLLVAEETLPNLRRAIRIAQERAGFEIRFETGRAVGVEFPPGRPFETPDASFWLGVVREAAPGRFARLERLKAPENQPVRGLQLHETSRSAAAALIAFPTIAVSERFPESAGNQLLDFCLLVFHQAYFALLPKLTDEIWADHRTCLSDGIESLAERMTRASDRFHILALYSESLGRQEIAAEYYREVVSATSSDAHEFMTVLQQCWGHFIDRRRFVEARDVLLDAYPRVCRKDLDEMRELIESTFDLATRNHAGEKAVPERSHSTRSIVLDD